MNKVITINLGGTAWQLEEGGYDTLRVYLETAGARLQGNPDREEILSDIEWAIAEKFRGLLSNHKTVVLAKEVASVVEQMGPIEAEAGKADASGKDGAGASSSAGAAREEHPPETNKPPRRLYRIPEGSELAGVCTGLAAYLRMDPTFIRLAFVGLTIFWGSGVLVYIVLAIVIPEANTPEEKKAASGDPFTTEDFIRRAREGYYEAMRGFPDRYARREWKRRFKREMRAFSHQWRFSWHAHLEKQTPVHPGLGIALPLISLLEAAVTIVWLCAMISLLASGTLLGVMLPASVPIWGGAIVLLFLFGAVVGPLKAARHACYWHFGRARSIWSPAGRFMEAMIWLAVAVILICLARENFSEVRAAIHAVPEVVNQAIMDIRQWWNGR